MAIYFSDREQAAQQLAVLLAKHKGPQTLVLAIPRGGVPIGSVLAHQLGAPLDLLMAAVRAVRRQLPAAVIVATPVCSHEARIRLKPEVDELISCYYPDPFIGVGRFYRQFEQVTDPEVRDILLTTISSIKPASSS